MSQPEIDEKAWEEWLAHPVTQAVKRIAATRRAEIKDQWEVAGFAAPSQFEMICANIAAQAECKALSLLEQLDYSMLEEVRNGERKWFETSGASGTRPPVRAGEDE